MANNPQAAPSSAWLAALPMRLAAGLRPQALLDELVDRCHQPSQHPSFLVFTPSGLIQSLEILVGAGAVLASGKPGCAFERLAAIPGMQQSMMSPRVISACLANRTEIPVHMMARINPLRLFMLTDGRRIDSAVADPSIKPIFHRRDAQGRTVSHWLWAPDGLLATRRPIEKNEGAGLNGARSHLTGLQWNDTLHSAWRIQSILQDMGVGLDVPGNDGVCAMDMCLQIINQTHLYMQYESCRFVAAHMHKMQMSSSTRQAPPNAAAARL